MTRPLDRYIRSADALSRLAEHSARLVRLQAILAQELPPPLAESCGVANLRGEELIIHARSNTVAARLKQMLPSLLEAYARQGVLLTGIKLRVEVRNPIPSRPAVARRDVPPRARGGLATLAAALPATSPLAQALHRLVRQSGGER